MRLHTSVILVIRSNLKKIKKYNSQSCSEFMATLITKNKMPIAYRNLIKRI